MLEITYQISSITTELRNLRDTLGALINAVHENTEFLETVQDSNKQVVQELQDRPRQRRR